MKKNIGAKMALYPMPVGVVGTRVDGRVNYVLAAHFGIVSHQHVLVSLSKAHYTNKGLGKGKPLSINLLDERMLPKAAYVGSVSGATVDKSEVFSSYEGTTGAPIVEESPLSIEGEVVDIYEIAGFENFILEVKAVHVREEFLKDGETIDYERLKPVLFAFPGYEYIQTGKVLGKCLDFLGKGGRQ